MLDPNNPPLGVPPLLWLLIFLLGGPSGIALLCSKTAARIPGVMGMVGRWWQVREPRMSEHIARAEIDRLVEDYERLSKAREEDRAEHRAEIAEVKADVAELRNEVKRVWSLFWSALGHVRVLADVIRRIDPDHELPAPPDILKEYL